jgi:hypothetical protein
VRTSLIKVGSGVLGPGYVYINGADFNFVGGEAPKPGYIQFITPDGQLR